MSRHTKYPELNLGLLPASTVNAALGTEMVTALVRLSRQAHRHIAEDHPNDYAVCIAALPAAIATPSFIGQGPGHTRNFELVRRMTRADGRAILVAISLDLDTGGAYRVVSC